MDKNYNPQQIETKWYQHWENSGYFRPLSSASNPYCIVLPPPNVTGSLHMGHGFQDTLMDTLIRYQRMQGAKTLWQTGTDHAGIATQMLVERQLLAAGKSRLELGREKFIQQVWQWKEASGGQITQQLRRLGASMDWSRECFTMDPAFNQAVQEVFIQLYQQGLIYRGQRLVNWDPHLLTAISDLEVIAEETAGQLWHIRYPLKDEEGYLIVATTRPETLLGDVAVAVHPEDSRYQAYIGKHLQLPLTERTIPIIADESVDPEFGSGCVKITPAHDFNDYALGQRHQLPLINIFTPNAHLNQSVPTAYQGLERFQARQQIIADLQAQDLIEKIEAHTLKIPRGDRSGAVIEPYLTNQWFMRMENLAAPAIAAARNGDIRFIPENWSKTYFQWLENIQDWCISRQLWWGHRIPAWYDEAGNIYVGHNEAAVRKEYQLSANIMLTQDEDVLDTWFSAALWPFASLGWPQTTPELQTYYPTNVLVTGFDIIFFWVARMIMLGLKFMGQVPFKEVYITGLIRDHEGQKMSKTKGNVLDPIDLIDGIELEQLVAKRSSHLLQPAQAEKIKQATRKQFPQGIPAFGTDALRFTYCALASTNRDIRFDLNRVQGYRNFCNKLWNAARYVLMNVEGKTLRSAAVPLTTIDQWLYSKLYTCIEQVHEHFKTYRFDLIAQTLYEFIWNEYCDWYLELTKSILNDSTINPLEQSTTRHTLLAVLDLILRLLHPIMPYITEEIWQRVNPLLSPSTSTTIMLTAYPQVDAAWANANAEAEVDWLKSVILGIRTIRSEMVIAPSRAIPLICYKGNSRDQELFHKYQSFIINLTKLASINWLTATDTAPPQTAIALVGELQLLIPMAGIIDVAAETARLEKELAKLSKEGDRLHEKLSNANFVQHAPVEVVAKERARLSEVNDAISKFEQQLKQLQ